MVSKIGMHIDMEIRNNFPHGGMAWIDVVCSVASIVVPFKPMEPNLDEWWSRKLACT